jgi:hypothetical protein
MTMRCLETWGCGVNEVTYHMSYEYIIAYLIGVKIGK